MITYVYRHHILHTILTEHKRDVVQQQTIKYYLSMHAKIPKTLLINL